MSKITLLFEVIVIDNLKSSLICNFVNNLPDLLKGLAQIYDQIMTYKLFRNPVGLQTAQLLFESIKMWATEMPYKGYSDIARSMVMK